MGLTYISGMLLGKLCFSVFGRWEVHGKEAVPPLGPLLVVSNHLSYADPPVLASSLPRRLHFLGKGSLFSNPISATFMRAVGVHPLNQDSLNLGALRWNLDLLSRDQALVLFPEGSRSRGQGMKIGKHGVAYLAAKSQAPILPVAITGTEHIHGYLRIPFPLCRINVTIGDPFTLPVVEGKLTKPLLQSLTDMIMRRVADLLPETYRGHYAAKETVSRR